MGVEAIPITQHTQFPKPLVWPTQVKQLGYTSISTKSTPNARRIGFPSAPFLIRYLRLTFITTEKSRREKFYVVQVRTGPVIARHMAVNCPSLFIPAYVTLLLPSPLHFPRTAPCPCGCLRAQNAALEVAELLSAPCPNGVIPRTPPQQPTFQSPHPENHSTPLPAESFVSLLAHSAPSFIVVLPLFTTVNS